MTDQGSESVEIKITDDQSYTLYSERYGEFYHCRGGAYLKAKHIFLEPVHELDDTIPAQKRKILEVGFGAGLNFFVTADHYANEGIRLEYTALEHDLLSAELFEQLHYESLLSKPDSVLEFISARKLLPDNPPCGEYEINIHPNIQLRLWIGNATEMLLENEHYDWVYHDPFSPAHNPELWSEAFIQRVSDAMREGGGLSTYSVNGEARRVMKRVGLKPEKRPGIPGKREVLVAKKPFRAEPILHEQGCLT